MNKQNRLKNMPVILTLKQILYMLVRPDDNSIKRGETCTTYFCLDIDKQIKPIQLC